MNDNRQSKASRSTEHYVRVAFAVLALLSLLTGLGLHLFADRLGISEPTARLIATAFVAAGVLDAAVLAFWERLFGSPR